MVVDSADARRKRKEEGRKKKRQRIEEAGGVRPRTPKKKDDEAKADAPNTTKAGTANNNSSNIRTSRSHQPSSGSHRFGRVMEDVPCRNRPRFSTLSIALPGSVLSNCQTKELRTLLAGRIARAATIYHVDEIIIFDDKLGGKVENRGWHPGLRRRREFQHGDKRRHGEDGDGNKNNDNNDDEKRADRPRSDPQEFMARLLQYCECPQYLRRQFFPMHPDLQFTGLLAPIDAPHHVRGEDRSKYREGSVMKDKSNRSEGSSLVNCGIRNRPVQIDRKLVPGIRCTVMIDPAAYGRPGVIKGKVVSPAAPREDDGTYWGYTTRLARSIHEVFDGCPYEGGYDLKIGTSERGDQSVEDDDFQIPKYEHSLIVFGGVAGIEECVDADESIKLPGSQSRKLFDIWLNTCPYQGSRTIRTEEAVLISLATLSPEISKSAWSTKVIKKVESSDDSGSGSSDDEGDDSSFGDGGSESEPGNDESSAD